MERGLLLPSIQVINSANGSEVSYKVQYAPVYTGKAKSRPLSGYEEEIVKRALRSHSEGDNSTTTTGAAAAGYSEQIGVEGRALDTANINLTKLAASSFAVTVEDISGSSRLAEDSFSRPRGLVIESTQLASRSLLGKRQHQVPPTIFASSGNDRAAVSNGYTNTVNGGIEAGAPPVLSGREAGHSESSIHANGFKRPPALNSIDEDSVEAMSEDFIRLKLHRLKQVGSSKQRLREAARGGGDVATHASSSQALQSAVIQVPPQQKARTQKEKATELRRYQRRIIYTLNHLMTDAEAKQFEHFIKVHGLRPKEYPYE